MPGRRLAAPRRRRRPPRAPLRSALAGLLLLLAPLPAIAGPPYANGFPVDPGFFPIGVWLQSPANAAAFKAIGINTFVGLDNGPSETQLAMLAEAGINVVAGQNEVALASARRGVIKAWLQADEPDNAQSAGLGKWGACIPAAQVAEETRRLSRRDPTRPVMINFGRGVADESWPGRGPCTDDSQYYDTAVQSAGIVSFDIYPVANMRPAMQGRLDYVARGVHNLRRRVAAGQSVWAGIETTRIGTQQRVTPAQLRSEVWMALIAGATGIYYFVHEWTGGFREDAIFRYPEIVAEVAKLDRTITDLAPALNSPDVTGKIAVASQVPIETLVKQHDGSLYVFAIAMRDQPAKVWFAVRGVRSATATVIGEDRRVAIGDGILDDAFAGYGVHLYQIPLTAGSHAQE